MVKSNVEREIKLTVPEGWRLPSLNGVAGELTTAPRPRRTLTAAYFDTEDLRLARWGITVRHRTGDASGWTVKLPEGESGPAMVRRELGFEGAPTRVPDGVTGLLRAYLRGASLTTVAQLRTSRVGFDLLDAEGSAVAEIVDDRVTIFEGRVVAGQFREVEVELTPLAPPDLLGTLVAFLEAAGATATVDATPKVFRALGPKACDPPDVVVPVKVRGNERAQVAVTAALAKSVARIIGHDPGIRIGDDPEDVHQARVGTRRLRSDLRTFATLLDAAAVAPLRNELRWAAAELGRSRDADVLLDRLRNQTSRLSERDATGVSALLRRLVAEHDEARSAMLCALDSERYVVLLDRLVAVVRDPPFTCAADLPAASVLPPLVAPAWRRLAKAMRAIDASSPEEALHAARIHAKRCRYAAEAVAPAIGEPASRLAKAVAQVQGVLGEHQDSTVAETWLRGAAAGAEPAIVLVAGELIAMQRQQQAAARASLVKVWRKAKDKRLRSWL